MVEIQQINETKERRSEHVAFHALLLPLHIEQHSSDKERSAKITAALRNTVKTLHALKDALPLESGDDLVHFVRAFPGIRDTMAYPQEEANNKRTSSIVMILAHRRANIRIAGPTILSAIVSHEASHFAQVVCLRDDPELGASPTDRFALVSRALNELPFKLAYELNLPGIHADLQRLGRELPGIPCAGFSSLNATDNCMRTTNFQRLPPLLLAQQLLSKPNNDKPERASGKSKAKTAEGLPDPTASTDLERHKILQLLHEHCDMFLVSVANLQAAESMEAESSATDLLKYATGRFQMNVAPTLPDLAGHLSEHTRVARVGRSSAASVRQACFKDELAHALYGPPAPNHFLILVVSKMSACLVGMAFVHEDGSSSKWTGDTAILQSFFGPPTVLAHLPAVLRDIGQRVRKDWQADQFRSNLSRAFSRAPMTLLSKDTGASAENSNISNH